MMHSLATAVTGFFDGQHFSAAGVGLLTLAAYQGFALHDWVSAGQSLLGGLAAFGLHVSIAVPAQQQAQQVVESAPKP